MSRRVFGAALAAFALLAPAASPAAELRDVLDTPAATSAFARTGLLNGLARAGKRVVAVGQRGHVLYSDDAGRTWVQAKVPVSSDLVAVTFPTPSHGWAVGHDGVVLHSADAGATWIRQLDGRSAGQAMVAWYAAEAAKGGSGDAAKLLDEAKRFAEQGAENPFLDVWFENERDRLRRRRLQPHPAHRGRGQDVGAVAPSHSTTRRRCISTRSGRRAARCTSPASRGCCSSSTRRAAGSARSSCRTRARCSGSPAARRAPWCSASGVTRSAAPTAARPGRRSRPASRSGSPAARWMRGAWCSSARRATSSSAPTTARASSPLKLERPAPAAAVIGAEENAVVIAGPRGVRAQPLN